MRPWLLRAPVRFWCAVRAATGAPLCRCERSAFTTKRRPGDVGLVLMRAILVSVRLPAASLLDAGEIDGLAFGEAHVGLLEVRAASGAAAEALRLAGHVDDAHGVDLHLEHGLHGGLDLGLGRVAAHAEHDLVGLLGHGRALLGHVRREQHGHQSFLAAHASFSSSMRTAPTVASTCSWASRLCGSIAETGSTVTPTRLREASSSFSS